VTFERLLIRDQMTLGGGKEGSPYSLVGKFLGCSFSWSNGGLGSLLSFSLHFLCLYFFFLSFILFFYSLIPHFSIEYFCFLEVTDILVYPPFSSFSLIFFLLPVPNPLSFFLFFYFTFMCWWRTMGRTWQFVPPLWQWKGAYLLELFGVIYFMFLGCQE
jgi:hypothetical protein